MMAFISRSRSRSRPLLIRGRGKFFRGRGTVGNRGEGLRITLSNRTDGGESEVQRSSRGRGSTHKQDRHSRDRRENPDYFGDANRDMRPKSAERKRHDHYEFRRGDVSPSIRRSHEKIDLAADAESLRITVGNEKFFKEKVDDSPRRVTPLSERLGPPVDMTEPLDELTRQRDYGERGRYSNDRFDCEKEKTYWLHEETQRLEKYKRSDERQLNRYSKRVPVDDNLYDKARKTGSKDHDWKNSHDEYSDGSQDHQRANVRHHRFEHRNMDSDTMHRRSDRYDKEDSRYDKRKYDRYKDYDSRKVPFSLEMKRDDFNKNYQSDRIWESVDSFENCDHDVSADAVERKKFHIHEMSNRDSSHREIESSMPSPNSDRRSPRIEREKRGGLVEQMDNELSSTMTGSVIQHHQSLAPSVTTKPLKSILKKRSDSAYGYDAGNQGGVAEQVSDFLKQFQAPLPSDELVTVTSGRLLQSNTNVPGCGQNVMDVDDEEKFLYGDSEINAANTKTHQSQALFPVLDKEVTKSQIIQEHNSENPKVMFDPSSCMPSWMKPQPSIEPGSNEENKGEDMDKTVQNILKSIGFNFDLSKRMQELAKLKKQKEEESQFSINKNASFLGGGISSADIRAKLFKKEDTGAPVESFTKEAKDTIKHSDKGYQDYPVNHQRDEPLVLTQDRNENFKDVDLIHQPTTPASQQPTPVSHFQPPPLHYPSFYTGMYHPAYVQHAGHPSLVPPGNPHVHLPPTYSYASPYTCAQHSYSTPVSHLAKSYVSHLSPSPDIKQRRATGSANLTIVPIADDGKKTKLAAPEVTKKAVKREREKSPEYSRIVIAPKSKSKDEKSPAQKILKVKSESTKDKTKKPNLDKSSDTIVHTESGQLSKQLLQEQEDEVKPSVLSTSEKQSLLKECEDRKKKLQVLEKELGKLKKHQNEIMRRRQRQRDGHKDPLLVQNSKLQEEITMQIRHLRKASEKSAFVLKQADKEDQKSSTAARKDVDDSYQDDTKNEKIVDIKYEFYDPGGHWCGVCHHVSASLFDHFTHLQAKKHKQKCDPYDRPWLTDIAQNNEKRQENAATVEVKAMKGVEFMMSTDAFYCSLCHVFSGDVTSAELHIKSEDHFAKYEKHLQQNEFYEKRYTLEKTAFLSQVKEEEKKNGEKEKVRKYKSLQREIDEVPHVVENLPSYESNPDSHDEERKQEENETPISLKHKSICEDKAKPQKEEITADSKQEDTTKGKIAIKLTGKTGIKPQPRILPPWTPVTKKELFRTKSKAEALPLKKGITKSESVQPASLDMFLTIGGPTTKKLPVYKLRSGTVKKPCNVRAKSPDNVPNQEGEKLRDMKSDMKLLGIEEDMSTPIAAKKPPPPRSQNLSLPKDPSSNSSSSAEELYSVFYQDSACTARDCTSSVNLDDIPIPPPPPQPSTIVPDSEETKEKDMEKPTGNKVMSSDMIVRSKALVVETLLDFTHEISVPEGENEKDCENLNSASFKDAVKIDSNIVVGDEDKESQEQILLPEEIEGVAGCKNDVEKCSDHLDETTEKQHLIVNEEKNVSELSVTMKGENTLPQKESTVNEKTKVSADLQTHTDITDNQEETSGHSCHLGDVIPVIGQDFEEEMATEDATIDLTDNSHIYPVDAEGVSSKALGTNTVTDNEDIGSNESCDSMHMDSDFEVLDEYEAD
ncbi:zinc finger protein 318-like [Haliotis asinina]|uniref:zinc finger protein 318-like n=1 Tax=Haliotis asinina TaxID=109174 RepID=UPI0035325A82